MTKLLEENIVNKKKLKMKDKELRKLISRYYKIQKQRKNTSI